MAMSKRKIFNKLGKTVKQKAGEIVKEYADKVLNMLMI